MEERKKMKNVVFLIAHLGGGGAERVTVSLANYFVRHSCEVSLIIFDKTHNEYIVYPEIKLYYLDSNKNKILDIKNKISSLRRYLKEIQPEYIISLGFSYRYLFFGRLINKYKFILSERNDPLNMYGKLDFCIVKYCLERAYHVVFQTNDAKSIFSSRIQGKSTVIPNPIKADLPEVYHGVREKRIVAYSRLNKQKNLPMLLKGFCIFSKEFPDFILDIYGTGECENELKELAEKIGIREKVNFKGFSATVHEDILKATCFVSTSNFEGISNSMLESLAIGLPCICTNCPVGGAAMFIKDKVNGFLIHMGDEEELANRLVSIASNKKLIDMMSKNAIKIRKELSVDRISELWLNLLK